MRVLLIRPNRNQADANALADFGIESLVDPYLKIEQVENRLGAKRMLSALQSPGEKWLVLTSTNALSYWGNLVGEQQLRAAFSNPELNFAAIGSQTAAQLREFGAPQVLVASARDGASLAEQLATLQPKTVVIPSGSIAMRDIPARLQGVGAEIVSEVIYATEPVQTAPSSVQAVQSGELTAVLLRSPSAARAFLAFNPNPNLALVAAGWTTAKVLTELGHRPDLITGEPDPEVVASEIFDFLGARRS